MPTDTTPSGKNSDRELVEGDPTDDAPAAAEPTAGEEAVEQETAATPADTGDHDGFRLTPHWDALVAELGDPDVPEQTETDAARVKRVRAARGLATAVGVS